MNLTLMDYIALTVYFGGILGIGFWFSRKNNSTEEYFLGGRSFPGWAIGLSLIGTSISSVTFIAYPADAFRTSWLRYLPNFAFPAVVLMAAFILLPFFRRGTISSSYEYLRLRFGPSISCYAACVFFVVQLIRTSTIVFLVSILMQSITGLDMIYCILLTGGVTGVYTVTGGFDAVVWTDVVQTITLVFGSIIIIGFVALNMTGGLGEIFSIASEHNKLSFTTFDEVTGQLEAVPRGFSLSEKTMFMLLVMGFFQYLTGQFDQTTVQRWCAAKSVKEARRSIYVLASCSLPIWASFYFVGTALWAYFFGNPDPRAAEMIAGTRKAEEIVPYFVINYLPAGITGIVIAAALAAAMSSLSSSINAASMVWVGDIYKKFVKKDGSEKHYLVVGFLASLFVSAFMLIGAFLIYRTETKTLMDFGLILGALTGGGIAATFIFGVFTKMGDARTIWIGLLASGIFAGYMLLGKYRVLPDGWDLPVEIYYTAIIGNLIALFCFIVASFIFKARGRDLKNLTVWTQDGKDLV